MRLGRKSAQQCRGCLEGTHPWGCALRVQRDAVFLCVCTLFGLLNQVIHALTLALKTARGEGERASHIVQQVDITHPVFHVSNDAS